MRSLDRVRTTITLDPDVAARLADVQREQGITFKDAVNEALRRGLYAHTDAGSEPYRMPVRGLGLRPGLDVDRIRDELSRLDDDRFDERRADAT